jgi:chromosome segregation ATPase
MTPDASPNRGTAALISVAIGLVAAASVGVMLWGTGSHSALFASELGRSAARATPPTLEDHVAALTAELGQVRAEIATLREGHNDTSAELSHIQASVAKAEIGLWALRITTAESEARRLDTAAEIASNLAQLKDETLHLRRAQDDTAAGFGSLRASVANSEIGVDSLRASTADIRQRIERIEVARDATSSIGKSHKYRGHKKWVAQR